MTLVLVALVALLALREWTAYQDRQKALEERRELLTAQDRLLDRIQMPEVVVAQNMPDTPQYTPFDDDKAFHEAHKEQMNGDS